MIQGLNERLFWMINSHFSLAGDVVMEAFTLTGSTISAILIATLALYLYRELTARNLLLLAITLAVGGLIVHGIKENCVADRPLAHFAEKPAPDGLAVHAPFERHSHRTFPSGHSQTAFSVAVFIVMVFRKHAAPWLAWAAMVAVSRVYLGVHFPLDIVAGMAVGSAVSALTVVLADKWSPARVAADAINAGVKKEL